jgi:hypothetical protein
MATLDVSADICTQLQCDALPLSQQSSTTASDYYNQYGQMIAAAGSPIEYACSLAGYAGPRVCTDPVCKPYSSGMAANGLCVSNPLTNSGAGPMPQSTAAAMPTMTNTATATQPAPQPALTPQDLNQKMPSIVNTSPAVIPQATCPDSFAAWISGNPLVAAIGLAALAYVVLGKD